MDKITITEMLGTWGFGVMTDENTIEIDSVIDRQIAYIMAVYGDRPEQFMIKIHELVIEWHCKGIAVGMKKKHILQV